MRRKGQATGKAAPEEPPGLHEVASKLNEILDRSNAIEEQLRTLEILKETKAKTSKKQQTRHNPVLDQYDSFRDCCDCVCKPVPRIQRTAKLSGSNQHALCQIMDLITDLRMDVSALATRQNQMKDELDRIRARLC